MAINPNIKKILQNIRIKREEQNITRLQLETDLNLGTGWIEAVESGDIDPPFDLVLTIIESLGIDFSAIVSNVEFEKGLSLDRKINPIQNKQDLILNFKYGDYDASYTLKNATIGSFSSVLSEFRNAYSKSDAIILSFFKAIEVWPNVNPSDIWLFIISKIYQDRYNHASSEINRDFSQSWKRASGWALEEVFARHYQETLMEHGILIGVFSKKKKIELLNKMRLNYAVEANKADVLLINTRGGNYDCFGVAHIKASIAERRQNDQNFSGALLAKNFFSPFVTMDCKAFPSSTPNNRGELGGVIGSDDDLRNDKRKEFEEEGYFSACFSYNSNTNPTPEGQKATSRIYKMDFKNVNDEFTELVIASRNRLYGR
ncbi:MAG: helix-turn-helix transcriptional regulator [Bacteroidetes bacterium]|nr:helix-turn-helix transcriptional regulator [Bacteroidota bacterium]